MLQEKDYKLLEAKSGGKTFYLYYLVDSCLYKKNGISRRNGDIFYKCIGKSNENQNCKVTGKLTNEYFIRLKKEKITHNHETHQYEARFKEVVSKMEQIATTSSSNIEEIYCQTVQQEKSPVLKLMNSKRIKKRIRRTRQKLVPQCKGAIDLGIFMKNDKFYREKFAVFRNEQFYRTNILYNDTNACIFVVQQFISIGLSHLWIDGTFSIIPKCFAQLLIVFSEINTMIYPIGYILMETRKKGLYMAVFKYLKETLKINPFKVICDYETALMKSIESTWPDTNVQGCYFHHLQCLKRKKNSLSKLSKLIKKNQKAKLIYRMFLKIPLLPKHLMEQGFEDIVKIQKKAKMFKRFSQFNTYYVLQWLSKADIKNFNVFNTNHRTNNPAEGFNSKLKRLINRNPSTYSFLSKLLEITGESYNKYLNNLKENVKFKSKSKMNEKLNRLYLMLNNKEIDVEKFLILLCNK